MSEGADVRCLRLYAGFMRYAQGGGLTAEGRKRREQVRLEAARRFEQRAPSAVIAAELGSASGRSGGGGSPGRPRVSHALSGGALPCEWPQHMAGPLVGPLDPRIRTEPETCAFPAY